MEEIFKLFDYMLDGIFIINAEKEVVYINVSASLMTKLKPRSIIGKKSYEHLFFADEKLFCMKDGVLEIDKTSVYHEVDLKTSKDILIKVQVIIQPINFIPNESFWMVYFHNVADEINLSTSLRLEVEEREKATKTIFKVQSELQEYSELALKDNMTGLGNFRYFETEVLKTLESSIDNNSTFSLVMIDVDKFKTFNDTYGHQQGDEVLRVIGKSISQAVRASDVVARYGGEEFVMILKNTKMTDLERICEKVRLSVQNAKVPKLGKSEEFLSVTISLGGVVIEPSVIREKGITDYKTLLEIADKNLYSAKNGGRNRTVVSVFS